MKGLVVIARPGGGRTLEAALRACMTGAAGTEPCAVVLAGGDEGNVPEEALADLLCGPLGIGAVVPLLYDARGKVAEAGTYLVADGTVAPFGTGACLDDRELAFRRDVPGTASAVVGCVGGRPGRLPLGGCRA